MLSVHKIISGLTSKFSLSELSTMEKAKVSEENEQEYNLLHECSKLPEDCKTGEHYARDRDDSGDCDQVDEHATSGLRPDGGYGWVVVAASFFSLGIVGGHFMSFGLLYPAISAHYDVPYGVSGWVGSFSQAMMHLLAFVYSSLINRFGCRVCSVIGSLLISIGYITSSLTTSVYELYITYGLITGVGIGLVFLSNIVIVQQYFHKRRALAAGLSNSGLSLGIVGMSLLVRYLLSQFAWQGTCLIVGGVFLNGIIAGYFLRPHTVEQTIQQTGKDNTIKEKNKKLSTSQNNAKDFLKDVFDFSLLKNPMFQLYCWTTFSNTVGMLSFYMHTPNRALHLGIDPELVGFLPSCIAIVTFVFRVLISFVANSPCVNRIILYSTGILLGGLLEVVYFLCTSTISIFLMCFAFGATIGICQTVQSTILVDLLGVHHIAKAQAFLSLFMGAGSLIATPFAGFLYDLQQDYKIPFIVCGALQVAGASLGYIIFCFTRKRQQPEA